MTASEVVGVMLRRGPIPPGPLAIYAALYQAGQEGVDEEALIERVRWGDRKSFAMVLRGISRRVAKVTEHRFKDYRALIVERHVGGRQRLVLAPAVFAAAAEDAKLHRVLMLPVDEILSTRNPNDPQGDKRRWLRVA